MLGNRRDGRFRILRSRVGRNCELSGDFCSRSRDHWFKLTHTSVHLIGYDTCLPHAQLHVLVKNQNLLGKAGWSPAAVADEAFIGPTAQPGRMMISILKSCRATSPR